MEVPLSLPLNYFSNDSNPEFETGILEILTNLKRFDDRTKENKPNMAKARKRLAFGASEVKKYLEVGKILGLIIATNLNDDMLLDSHFKYCIQQSSEIPVVYCLSRKQLGNKLLKTSSSARIGIIGILKLDGVYELWNASISQLSNLQTSWLNRYKANPENIWLAAYYGHLNLLTAIFSLQECGKFINCGSFETGKTPLMVAIERDHFQSVKVLLENGADQDIPDFALNRPCHFAKSRSVANILEFSEKLNAAGLSALDIAVVNGNVDVLDVFLSKASAIEKKASNLMFCAARSRTAISIEFLLRKFPYFPRDSRNKCGNSVLMEAVQHGSYEPFKFFISHGFEVDFRSVNNEGQTILELSKMSKNIGIARYLEKSHKISNEN